MRRTTTRNLLMPALLAMAIAPLSLAAIAAPDKDSWHEQHQQRFEEQRQAIFERAGLDEETRSALEEVHGEHMQALRDLHEQHRDSMAEILDEEQRDALREAKRELRQEQHAERRDERRQNMQQRLTTLVDGWGLSNEEREELTELRESLYADMQELREQSFDTREERREAWQALRDEHQEALGELLSEEQIEELGAAMRPSQHKGHGHHGGERR